jgi:hypothetical protein
VLEYPIHADCALIKPTEATAGATRLAEDGAQLRPDHGARRRSARLRGAGNRSAGDPDPEAIVTREFSSGAS